MFTVLSHPAGAFQSSSVSSSTVHQRLSSLSSSSSSSATSHWLDYLKFDGTSPDFDVIEKTKQYNQEEGYRTFNLKLIPSEYYDHERYIFRGPIVGPINRKDLVETNTVFGLPKSFPDLSRETFGHTVDPENPYRVLYFERWKATNTGDFDLMGLIKADATQRSSVSPVFPFSVTWTPEGKIIYECLTTAVDRFEGNTKGKVAVFGLLETAGVSIDNSVNNPFLSAAQRLGRAINLPAQVFSREEDIPAWWKSKSRGAEPNDM